MSRGAWILVAILWAAVATRVSYDAVYSGGAALPIARPLAELPMDTVGPGWKGSDIELTEEVIRRTGTDDRLQRRYRRGRDAFTLYVGYVAGFRENSIHHPLVCFPSQGLILDKDLVVDVPLDHGRTTAAFNEYRWTSTLPGGPRAYTLSTFIYNGEYEPSEVLLRANGWRARYCGVITLHGRLVGDLEETRAAYFKILGRLLPILARDHFPSQNALDGERVGTAFPEPKRRSDAQTFAERATKRYRAANDRVCDFSDIRDGGTMLWGLVERAPPKYEGGVSVRCDTARNDRPERIGALFSPLVGCRSRVPSYPRQRGALWSDIPTHAGEHELRAGMTGEKWRGS